MHRLSDVATITLNPALDRTVTIRSFKAGAVNRVEATSDRPGGKGINVAAALATTGQRVATLGFLGKDNEAVFSDFLRERGIEDRFIRLPGRTRVGIKISDPVLNETTDINFPGLTPTLAELAGLRQQLARLESRWCVVAGSLPPGVHAGLYAELIATLKSRGILVALDTSGPALREALVAQPDLIKPNVHELEALVGRPLPTEEDVIFAAQALVATGIGLVVVSRGADGACFVTAEECVVARPPQVTVHSTVGAGDAMVAGIVAARLRELPLVETARLATAYSLAVLTGPTASPLRLDAINAFLPRVSIQTPTIG